MALEGRKSGVSAIKSIGEERRVLGERVVLFLAENSANVPIELGSILDEHIIGLAPEVLRVVAYKGGRDY